ncbi:MAG: sodium-extruding oxaloacetate decarboxylase subunit alpha [Actinomycetota bacterium]
MAKRVAITETVFRDAHQSLAATRMRTTDMLPSCEKIDAVGFFSIDSWGGATFDTMIRFLNEDPWARLRNIKSKLPNTRVQMLLRGQNVVGYRNYPDDIVEAFVRLAAKNGLDLFRIFDALNDIRNMDIPVKAAKATGKHVQGCISYTTSPVHTIEKFVEFSKELTERECDSICIKDMAGLISPQACYDLVKAIKKEVNLPVCVHSHCTSGMAPIAYWAGIEAGADIIDTAISPWSWGSSQPPTEPMVASLADSPYSTGLDLDRLVDIGFYFLGVRNKYAGLISPIAERPDVSVLLHQIPGGMLSNLHSQLKEQNALDKYQDVLNELPRVREELGFPPLVTPTSQVVGTQAVFNVLTGKRYGKVSQEVKDYCLGLYGRPPAPIDPDILRKVIGKEKPIDCRPADLLEPQLAKLKKEADEMGLIKNEEDLLTYALFPNVAPTFLKGEGKEEPLAPPPTAEVKAGAAIAAIPTEFEVSVDGEEFRVTVNPLGMDIAASSTKEGGRPKDISAGGIVAPLQGLVLEVKVAEGDKVKKGDVVVVVEAMKMQTAVHAESDGTVIKIWTVKGENVASGDLLLVVE